MATTGVELPRGMAEMAVPLSSVQEPKIEDLTFVDLVGLAFTKADAYLAASEQPSAKREYALAKTAIEDAVMRFNRARSMDLGCFNVTDTEDPGFLQMLAQVKGAQSEEGGDTNG